ncbi:putative ATP-dependent RNA helicase TDRD12 isoform X2 [Scyliorhinus canicula]|uniref:putative ATP-dependent RNA helicase TDRD12 isoform X2 n=1 Tax=Scyliorhinus canicula TaxID=7830 RepID=UPI0018F3886C|nr:putative ATP-dependent RNA helicase TDRD12 isoform X2 [Scyliorhinus canicula]
MMIEIFIIKVEDPGCFWGRITNGFSDLVENANQYERLEEKMNQLYHRSHEDLEEIKLPVLEQGQICAIYCHELRCWCRAILKSLVSSGSSYLAECFLVDYAKHILVKAKDVRRAVDSFWKLPYRAKRFSLFGIQPMTLHIDVCEEKAKIGPAVKWDSAAIQYFQRISLESEVVEAKLQGAAGDTFAVQLYLTLNDETVCLNDDLVAKFFACYISPKNQNLAKNLKSSSEVSSVSCQKEEAPVKKNIGHAALALWSETVQGTALTILNQGNEGSAGQEAVSQCLQSRENLSCENLNKQCSKTTVSISSSKPVESVKTFSPCPLEKQSDCKKTRFYFHGEMRKDKKISTAMQKYDEIPASTRLLQFLNPDPLNTKNELEFHLQQPSHKMAFDLWNGVLVHSYNKLSPCRSMEMSPVSLDLKKELYKIKTGIPNIVQSYCWPAIGRGCDLVAVSKKGDDPLLYIPPLLTFLRLPSVYSCQPRRNLPLAIIICPGRQKAHFVCQVLMDLTRFSRPLSLSLILVGQDPEETKKMKLTKACDVVVTTPHSLIRILQVHCLFFIRLSHLVLDRVDVLFEEAMDEMTTILQSFREATNVPERRSTLQQLIAVGKHWTKQMGSLVKENQSDPYVVITAMEEAALYGNVHQVVQVCLDCEKTSFLLTMLDFTSEILQKTIIFTNCAEEVDHVFKALGSNSNFCMKVHEGMSIHVSNVMEQWNKKFNPGTHVILVTTDNYLNALRITDATCVIHYHFPPSWDIFGARLCCMVDNFDNLIVEGSTLQSQSIILLTDKDAPQASSILHYLERTDAKVPKELYTFISDLNNIDAICYDKSLCKYLKAYGICRENKTCPSRHRLHRDVDKPRCLSGEKKLPASGYVEITPTCISDATSYYGRIIHHRSKWEDPPVSMEEDYLMLLKDMADYYSEENHRKPVEQLVVSALYGLEEKTYSRVQLIALSQKTESAVLSNARIKYIDIGQTGQVMQKQLLELPAKFQGLPPQVVEFIICRVKPIDNEMDWNPQVSRFIKQKISNKSLNAKIVLALGNTLWLNTVVHMAKLTDLKTTILEYNIRSEIMNSGFGTDNAEHIEQLKELCRIAGLCLTDEDSPLKQPLYDKKLEYAILKNDGNYYSVIISEFHSPKQFYVQLVETREALCALENEINQRALGKETSISGSYVPAVGDLCLAFCETKKRWRRVEVLSVLYTKRNCTVFFVDFGTCSCVSLNNIQPLVKDVLQLPFQAICCSLFGVEPVEENWNPEIKELVFNTFQDKELQVKVIEQNRNDLTAVVCYHVVVQDPSNAGSLKLSECIVSKGQGEGPPAILNQLFPEEAVINGQTSSISCLGSSVCALLGDQNLNSSSLRTTTVEELKNMVLQYPADNASESSLSFLCRLLQFLSTKEQADVIVAMTHLAKMQVRNLDEIKNEKGICVLVNLLQVTNAELQESVCVALGILSENRDLSTAIIDADALKHLCHLLKKPIENNVWEAIIGALAALLSSSRVCEEIEEQDIICHLCTKIQQSSKDKVLENILKVLCHLSGRPQSLNLMLSSGLAVTVERLLASTSNRSALYEIANNLKFSLASFQNLYCLQNGAAFCDGNTDIVDVPEDAKNRSTMDHKSFHPEIKWHQKEDRLILNVKLRNFTKHSCKFGDCRVVFSAFVGIKLYLADLELQGSILEEKCSCVAINEEPVITLFKEENGEWSNLLKFKNPNVTFDFNYFEEAMDDVSLPIFNDFRRKGQQVIMEPSVDECGSFTSANDSSEEDY